MSEPTRFPNGCVASPHHLASSAGLAVLAQGGNAVDAAIAANLTMGVVAPFMCGYGGDLFAIVWDPPERSGGSSGRLHAYNGSGRSSRDATPERIRDALGSDEMPLFGPHTVTSPGAVEGWFTLLERFGTRSFGDLAQAAIGYARNGAPLWTWISRQFPRMGARYADDWGAAWRSIYGEGPDVLYQPDLARTIEMLASDGPDAYYRGAIATDIAETLQRYGAFISTDDLAAHTGDWVELLSTTYRDAVIFEHPPNSQGVVTLIALNILEEMELGTPESADRQHILLEATKLALGDREMHVSDPAHMQVDPTTLASKEWAAQRRRSIDPTSAADPTPGRAAVGGTIYLCTADADGMLVSLIQSNYLGFGSGVTVPGWGINLQNRGTYFSLDPEHVNVIAPSKRTMHTLMPAMAFRDDKPWIVFGTEGGDGQPQTHVQVFTRLIDDRLELQEAMNGPRWNISVGDWTVSAESRFGDDVLADLEKRGHRINPTGPWEHGFSNGIEVRDFGYAAATDRRIHGAALGL